MTPEARLATVMEALTEVWSVARPADMVLSAFFRARRFIGAKDRADMAGALYRILRSQARLSWHLAQAGFVAEPRSLALADQVLSAGVHPERLDRMCDGSRYAPDTLSMHERDLIRGLEGQRLVHPDMPDDVRLECPDWAAALLQNAFGDRTEDVLAALLQPAPLDLRVNRLKADRDTLLAELQAMSWAAEPCRYTPDGIRLHKRPNLNAHPALQTGLADIQDEGSQLVALAAAVRPGMRVLDFCAGAGGKTLALAAMMDNRGKIVACDVLAKRLERSRERLRRAGVHNVDLHPIESERDPWLKRHYTKAGGAFDCVLVDAPCSGTGTWRRNPESRWRQLGPGLDELVPLQASILESAARLVKPGGRLIYATCSLLPIENGEQVQAFLEKHNNYSLLPIDSIWQDEGIDGPPGDASGCLSLNPAAHGTDGFFAAVLTRAAA